MTAKSKRKKEKLSSYQKKARRKELVQSLKPLLWAFVAWFIINTIIHLPGLRDHVATFMIRFTTYAAYWFGKVLFLPVEVDRLPYLTVNNFRMEVIVECTAYTFYLFAITLVIFARWPLRHKFTSLGIMILGIFVMNNLRFISMGYLGSYRPEFFEVAHDLLWNVFFGFIVFGLWAWRELTARRATPASGQVK